MVKGAWHRSWGLGVGSHTPEQGRACANRVWWEVSVPDLDQ